MSDPRPLSPLEAGLQKRLRLIDSSTDAGNGTLLADAVASLIAADAVQAGVTSAAVASLSDAALKQTIAKNGRNAARLAA